MSEQIEAVFSDPAPEPDWSDRSAVIEYLVEGQRPFEGTHPFEEAGLRILVGREFDRTNDMAATNTNHWMLDGGDPIRAQLGQISAPTLVLHGTADPLFPIGHGKALADEIPGASLIPLEGVGHRMPPRHVWGRHRSDIATHSRQLVSTEARVLAWRAYVGTARS